METFPILRTNAVAQYASTRETAIRCEVYRYVDGSEQHIRDSGAPMRRWTIRLAEITDQEAAAIAEFFGRQRGRAGTFVFVDPWTTSEHTVCFDDDTLNIDYKAENVSTAEITLREVMV